MRKMLTVLVFWLLTYPVGGIGTWVAFEILWGLGCLEIKGIENFPKQKGRILLCPNHCSLVEPILLIGLFGPKYLLRPWKYGPWNLADNQNYFSFRKWGWAYWPMWPKLIRVDRTAKKGGSPTSLRTPLRLLRNGANIIVFAEGGRTSSVKTGHLKSERGKLLRPLKTPPFIMSKVSGVLTVPVWFEYHSLTNMKLAIGQSQDFTSTPTEEIAGKLEKILLALADTV